MTFPVVTQRPFTDPAQYDNIILRANQDGGSIVRLKDVARSKVGLRQYIIDGKLNGNSCYLCCHLPAARGEWNGGFKSRSQDP